MYSMSLKETENEAQICDWECWKSFQSVSNFFNTVSKFPPNVSQVKHKRRTIYELL